MYLYTYISHPELTYAVEKGFANQWAWLFLWACRLMQHELKPARSTEPCMLTYSNV